MSTKTTEFSIILTGLMASARTLALLKDGGETLQKRYRKCWLTDGVEALSAQIWKEADILELLPQAQIQPDEAQSGSSAQVQTQPDKKSEILPEGYVTACGTSGVFGVLWRLGEELDSGLMVKLENIPVKQITLEICDYYDINPYEADSTGCFMIVTSHPGQIVEKLEGKGIRTAVIGRLTENNGRVIINGENVRFLNKPSK